MRRFPALILFAVSAAAQNASDLAAIEKLHEKDLAAAKIGDIATLATLWTDDAVALPPGEPPVVGFTYRIFTP